ncbi:MAG: hypothetical protein OXH65_10165 [Paracoccaceae bacterium]|nr:hypothetical protein [Paracoccaceae bacterium]MDE2675460.1 hypothetical protein [Paracoccaceae bacterium]
MAADKNRLTIDVELTAEEFDAFEEAAKKTDADMGETIIAFASFGMDVMRRMAEYQNLADLPALGDRAKPN